MIKLVPVATVLLLRARILRPGRPLTEAQYPRDDEPTTFHLGHFTKQDELAAVATFEKEDLRSLTDHLRMPTGNSYRLRGMAVNPSFRRKGFGKQLLIFAESELRRRGCQLLWFNAREAAFGFYKYLGYSEYGDLFDIPPIGNHRVMFRVLHPS